MDKDDGLFEQVANLLAYSLDGDLQEQQQVDFHKLICEEPVARDYYFKLIYLQMQLKSRKSLSVLSEEIHEEYLGMAMWQALAEYERAAEPIKLAIPIEKPDLITGVRERRKQFQKPRKVSLLNLYVAITGLAALFLMIAYVTLSPHVIPQPVAMLMDSYEAVWHAKPLEAGSRLDNNQNPIQLLSGLAKLQFNNGAEVILEGPSEFQLISAEQMRVTYGKMTAVVPPLAAGFRVDTPAMSVIDLGTEFSIKMDGMGVGSVHLFSGKASLLPGIDGKRKSSHLLMHGQARRIDSLLGQVEDIRLDELGFVRRLDSEKKFIWHGQPVDLANIVAGGDGFDTITGIVGIDPQTGHRVSEFSPMVQFSTATYNPVPGNPFVDGVFIPDGGLGKNVISSAGHIFPDCPDTAGLGTNLTGATSHHILTFCDYDDNSVPDARKNKLPVFHGTTKGTAEEPAVLLHSNVGITFDLKVLRNCIPGLEIVRFVSSYGLPDSLKGSNPRSDFWVLVDGQLRFCNRVFTHEDGILYAAVDIMAHDRFLTIAVTDAAHTYEPGEGTYADDYVYLINPQLIITGTYD